MSKLIKQEIKDKIVELRKHGRSMPEISQILGVNRATAWRISKNTTILPEFKQRWLARRNASKIMSERNWDKAILHATTTLTELSHRERMLFASALYWAEGSKSDFSFSNTDSKMVAVFMDILRTEFHVKDLDFKISIRIYEDLDKDACIRHWSTITKLDLWDNVSINVLKGKKIGKLKFGMCRVRVKKAGLLFKKISAINTQVNKIISPHSSTDRIRHS